MPPLPHSIELHDSHLASITGERGELTIALRPAYIHRDDNGWLQDADIVVGRATWGPRDVALPQRIYDGAMNTTGGPYHNLLMLPLKWEGPVSLELQLEDGSVLRPEGASVCVNLRGEPTFLEVVPSDTEPL